MTDKIFLIGKGGHAKSCLEALGPYRDKATLITTEELYKWTIEDYLFVAIGDNHARCKWVKKADPAAIFGRIVHGASVIHGDYGIGVFIGALAYVGPDSKVGNFAIINTGAILEHDSVLDDGAHMAPRSVACGHVEIGARTLVGAGAVIRDHVKVGKDCVIGAGSVVTRNVPDNTTGWGVPFKIMRRTLAA